MAKMHATEAAQRVIDRAVQLFGGAGRHQGRQGRGALPGNPRAAHLRRRDRSAEGRDRARSLEEPCGRKGRGHVNGRGRARVRDRSMTMIRSGHIDTFARDNLPPQDAVAGIPVHAAGVAISGPRELRHRVRRQMGDIGAGRSHRDHCRRDETLTYAQLAERINRIANVLTRDLGMVPGNRVLLRSANNPMMIAAYLAVMKAGGVTVATMPLLRAKELSYTVKKAKIKHRALRQAARRRDGEDQGARARPGACAVLGRRRTRKPDEQAGLRESSPPATLRSTMSA